MDSVFWGRVAGYAIFSAVLGGIATAIGRRKARALLRGDRAVLASIPVVPSDLAGSDPEQDMRLEREAARVAASEGWEAAAKVFTQEMTGGCLFGTSERKSRNRYLARRARACTRVHTDITLGIVSLIFFGVLLLCAIIGVCCLIDEKFFRAHPPVPPAPRSAEAAPR